MEHVLDLPSVVLGRSTENHVVVDSVTVSRRHARLTVDSGRVLIEDLGSDGGTFVGGIRLPPNTPYRLSPGQPFLLGDVEAAFVPEGEPLGNPSDGQTATPTPQGVAITVAGAEEPIAPGSQVALSIGLTNRSNIVDEFAIRVAGLPADWVQMGRPSVTLMPGGHDEITVVITPPRTSAAPAGRHEFAVGAVSRASGADVRVLAVLTLLPFTVVTARLQPIRSTGEFRLTVTNEGNAETLVTLTGIDDEEALSFAFPSASLVLPVGDTQVLQLVVATKEPWVGTNSETRSFSIEFTGGEAVQRITGQLILEPSSVPEAPIRPAVERNESRTKGRPWLTQLYIGGLVVFGVLALLEGHWEWWTFGLGAWAVALPLARFGLRSTSSLNGVGGFLTRIGCLGSVFGAAVVAGILLLIAIESV